jgi:IclR family pca regulon transcriptional regulator
MAGAKLAESVQRAFSVLEVFTPARPTMKLREVSDTTGLPKVTAFRFLKTLMSLGYIAHDPRTKTYSLTARVLSLGFTVLASIPLREVALPYLDDLSRVTQQNVNLGIIDGTDIVYIERIKRRRILNIDNYVGTRLKLYETAIGKAAMAFMPDVDLQWTLSEILKDPHAISHIGPRGKKLLKELGDIRTGGYALNNEELIKGLRSIAAPIRGAGGTSEGAINLPVFSAEVSLKELTERYLPLLLEAADRISAIRGFLKQIVGARQR